MKNKRELSESDISDKKAELIRYFDCCHTLPDLQILGYGRSSLSQHTHEESSLDCSCAEFCEKGFPFNYLFILNKHMVV
jgi:hypothetical protein